VATKWTESLQRYLKSANTNGLKVKVLGLGDPWTGGDVRTNPGGGQKLVLLKNELQKSKDELKDRIIMFTDR